MLWFAVGVLMLAQLGVFGQTVSIKDGNVVFSAKDGSTVLITSLGLDSDPELSVDRRLIVFVRRTPGMTIATGLSETDKNELWVGDVFGKQVPRRVLTGHAGEFEVSDRLVLAGFSHPQFSPDSKRIYFVTETWATGSTVRMLDVDSGVVRLLYRGEGVEVMKSGKYAGYIIALKAIPHAFPPPHIFRYWLLDQNGKDVAEIGDKESDVRIFKSGRF
jgi:hypothetical protein